MTDKISNRSDSTGNHQDMTNFNGSIIVNEFVIGLVVNGMVGMHQIMSNSLIL